MSHNQENLIFTKILKILTALVLFNLQRTITYELGDLGISLGLFIEISYTLTAFYLILDSILEIRKVNNRHLAIISLFIISIGLLGVTGLSEFAGYDTDIMTFSNESAHSFMNGKNPYNESLHGSLIRNNFNGVTWKIDGIPVTSLSYPSLSFLLYIPQLLLGIKNLLFTSTLFYLSIILFLILESPKKYSLAPIVILFNVKSYPLIESLEPLWILPFIISMRYWYRSQKKISFIFLGLSFAVKQTAWFIAPFLLIAIYKSSDTLIQFKNDFKDAIVYGGVSFFLPNIIFLLNTPIEWFKGVFTPVGLNGPLFPSGIGISILNTMGISHMPNTFYSLLTIGIFGILLGIYYLKFKELRHIVWITPMILLWFNSRSFISYFIYFGIIAYYIVICKEKYGGE